MALSASREMWIDTTKVTPPTGHTVITAPAVTIASPVITEVVTLSLAANTYENATVATAFNNLIAGAKTALDGYIENTLGLDLTGFTVNYTAQVTSVTRGLAATSIYLPAANDVFRVTFTVKISAVAV